MIRWFFGVCQGNRDMRLDHPNEIGADTIEIFDTRVMGEIRRLGASRENTADGVDELPGVELGGAGRRNGKSPGTRYG